MRLDDQHDAIQDESLYRFGTMMRRGSIVAMAGSMIVPILPEYCFQSICVPSSRLLTASASLLKQAN